MGERRLQQRTYYNSATQSQQPLVIYDPQSVSQDPVTGRWLRTAFPDNKIPAATLNTPGSKMAQKILSYMPAPNVAPRAGQNPFTTTTSFRNRSRQSIAMRWPSWTTT